jgi:hypothetical protein
VKIWFNAANERVDELNIELQVVELVSLRRAYLQVFVTVPEVQLSVSRSQASQVQPRSTYRLCMDVSFSSLNTNSAFFNM